MELFTASGKLEKCFFRLEIFDVCITGDMTHTENLYLSKNFFNFPVAMNNSIKVGPLVFLL
jgi:hypothetical protein